MDFEELNKLTLRQLRALACQNKVEDWRILERAALLRALEKLDIEAEEA